MIHAAPHTLRDRAALGAAAIVLAAAGMPESAAVAASPSVAEAAEVAAEVSTAGVVAASTPAFPLEEAADGGGQSTVHGSRGRWQWPQPGQRRIVARFDAPEHRYGAGHRGIDIAGTGSAVHAVEAGTVRFAGSVAGKPVVSIVHADGLISTYEPVVASVKKGQRVQAEQVIGELVSNSPHSHCASTCLHVGARIGEDYIDPEPLLGLRGPSVLYPRTIAAEL